jgi:hypothetical protein
MPRVSCVRRIMRPVIVFSVGEETEMKPFNVIPEWLLSEKSRDDRI